MTATSHDDHDEETAAILPLDEQPPARPQGPLRRPPNYSSRRVQSRLLVLVSMFMLVLLAMDRVRDPKMWEWLWAGERWAQDPQTTQPPNTPQMPQTPAQVSPDPLASLNAPKVNTKLAPPAPEGTPHPEDSITSLRPLAKTPDEGSVADRIDDDLWAHLLQALDAEQQFALDRALYLHRHQRPLDATCIAAWPSLIDQIEERSSRYFADAKRSTEHSTLDDGQLSAWLMTLQQQVDTWQLTLNELAQLGGVPNLALPPWETLSHFQSSTQDTRRLQRIQRALDRLSIANIKDNTVHRPTEVRAWFRMMEKLQTASWSEATAETERVGFLQLFRQPDTYRGELVTLHGAVQLAYRLQAPRNAFDIEGYTVMWVRPTTGPSSPVVVYSLEMPEGFPEVVDRDAAGNAGASTKLDETVDITGYYFKNWAYRSQDGINTAPLMLARSPQWMPTANLASQRAELNPRQLIIGVAVVGVVAVALAGLVFYTTRWPQRQPNETTSRLQDLQDLDLPSTSEQLQRMSEKDLE